MKIRNILHIFLVFQFILISIGPLFGLHAHSDKNKPNIFIHIHSHDEETDAEQSTQTHSLFIYDDQAGKVNVAGKIGFNISQSNHIPEPLFEHIISNTVLLKLKIKTQQNLSEYIDIVNNIILSQKDIPINRFILYTNNICRQPFLVLITLRAPPLCS